MLFDELRNPLSSSALAAQAGDPVVAIEMYKAVVMTVDTSCLAAKKSLGQPSEDLNLPGSLIAAIHKNTSAAPLVLS